MAGKDTALGLMLLVSAATLLATPAATQIDTSELTGRELYDLCARDDDFCVGFIAGAVWSCPGWWCRSHRSSVWSEAWSGCHGGQPMGLSIGEPGKAFQAEVTAADRPLVRLLEHQSTDQANDGLVVRKDADERRRPAA
jgi:hypothetical protein